MFYLGMEHKYIVMRCTIWYHLYDLKHVKNTYGGVQNVTYAPIQTLWLMVVFKPL